MTRIYDSRDYALSRLQNTIVMHNRKPVQVLGIDRKMNAEVITPIHGRYRKKYTVPCEELNILNMRLGFVNTGDSAKFLARRSLRYDWRQGLRPNNVSSTDGDASYEDIGRALLHRYPTFEKALDSGKDSCAWCEDFAIKSDMSILWRYDIVGKFSAGGIKLKPKFGFLSNAIKESINGCYEVF